MLCLGLDPSLTNYGWAIHDTEAPVGTLTRCVARGRFQTPSKMEFIDRFVHQRDALSALFEQHKIDKVGIEFPVFDEFRSETMYGLFLFSCEALKKAKVDVVFWTPLQAKAHARETIVRPQGWPMDKPDMVEAATADCAARMNHNEADAYLVGRLAARFWLYYDNHLDDADLTKTERQYFSKVHTFVRGKRAGKTVRSGMIFRENDRFFPWSTSQEESTNGSKE